jgi:dihydropyrimidine dehydrogenase (NAD+) subunit PreA
VHLCIQGGRCHIACEDNVAPCDHPREAGKCHYQVIDAECVGCNLCVNVWPVENCITMVPLPIGAVDLHTGRRVEGYANWTTHPSNPATRPGSSAALAEE